jgi:hypothetical protein
MSSSGKAFLTQAVPLLLFLLAGCGGSNVVPVTGTLTYKGEPVKNAYIDFVPANGRPSWGETDEQGRFKLNYERGRDGALIGKHKVWVRRKLTTTAEKEAEMMGKRVPESREMTEFFDKYSPEKSNIEVEIDRNTKELTLNWD